MAQPPTALCVREQYEESNVQTASSLAADNKKRYIRVPLDENTREKRIKSFAPPTRISNENLDLSDIDFARLLWEVRGAPYLTDRESAKIKEDAAKYRQYAGEGKSFEEIRDLSVRNIVEVHRYLADFDGKGGLSDGAEIKGYLGLRVNDGHLDIPEDDISVVLVGTQKNPYQSEVILKFPLPQNGEFNQTTFYRTKANLIITDRGVGLNGVRHLLPKEYQSEVKDEFDVQELVREKGEKGVLLNGIDAIGTFRQAITGGESFEQIVRDSKYIQTYKNPAGENIKIKIIGSEHNHELTESEYSALPSPADILCVFGRMRKIGHFDPTADILMEGVTVLDLVDQYGKIQDKVYFNILPLTAEQKINLKDKATRAQRVLLLGLLGTTEGKEILAKFYLTVEKFVKSTPPSYLASL